MTGEVNAKLVEIVQKCSENQINVTITQEGSKRNLIKMGVRELLIQIGDKDDENLMELLESTLETI